MAYNELIPVITNEYAGDLSAMQENFAWLRKHFLNGAIPIDGAETLYSYDGDNNVSGIGIKIAGTTVATATYSYDTEGNVELETWDVDGSHFEIAYVWNAGNLTSTTITIT
jgi:hypothetical protein